MAIKQQRKQFLMSKINLVPSLLENRSLGKIFIETKPTIGGQGSPAIVAHNNNNNHRRELFGG